MLFSFYLWFSIFLCMFFVSLSLLKNWSHAIMLMMLLEAGMLQVFFSVAYLGIFSSSPSLLFLFAALMVIEASVGLSVLTLISRSHGNDYVKIF